MFEETKENPEESLGVEPWLWDLCVRLWESNDPVLRAASAGLMINRNVPDDNEDDDLVDRLSDYFKRWINNFTKDDLDELERSMGLEVCRLQAWLARLVETRFPESELIAFACARELVEAASCVLVGRNHATWIIEDLNRLDHAVVDAFTAYGNPANEPERPLFVKRENKLLKQACDRANLDWWGMLAGPT